MILDTRSGTISWPNYFADEDYPNAHPTVTVTVDGVETKQVWFADMHRGIVKTYDVLGDNRPSLARDISEIPSDVEILDGGLLSKTMHGKVAIVMTSPDISDATNSQQQ